MTLCMHFLSHTVALSMWAADRYQLYQFTWPQVSFFLTFMYYKKHCFTKKKSEF